MAATEVLQDGGKGLNAQIGAPILLIVILAMMTLPIPPLLLDMLFSFNIALALLVLMVSVYTLRPLDFAVFPTILLVATLLRLALNVASTRVVLLHGHSGGASAGKVIEAFGEVVVGGNYAVGMVVFAILVIINFAVVTKGAGRISEVSARFTLDAMPGKQMAIDADLNAGIIDQEQARQRRQEIGNEADFYGAMDGASKFVRGDAIAGILILVINIIGGLAIGIAQHDLSFAEAMKRYALLTIGDGLVAQIPSLLLSTAAAIMVTRVNSEQDMGRQVVSQMLSNHRAISVAAVILGIMGIIPGMPHFAFLGFAGICGYLAYIVKQRNDREEQTAALNPGQGAGSANPQQGGPNPGDEVEPGSEQAVEPTVKELGWDDVQPVDLIGLEVGYRIIPLVDKAQGGQLLARIKGVRKKLSQDLGFLVPTVHIRDNLELMPNVYRLSLMGVTLAEAEIHPDRDLAINPGQVFGQIQGINAKDPAFGLDAIWIEESQKEQAQTLGYTVVDASTVIATHLNHVMHKHAHELIGHEEVQKLMENLAKSTPKLVEHLTPKPLPLSAVLRVLQNLLREQVPIRDIRSIAEALAETANKTLDIDVLTAAAREALSRMIVQNLAKVDEELSVITLQPSLEQILIQAVQHAKQAGGNETDAVIEPSLADRIQRLIVEQAQKQELAGKSAILLVSTGIRGMMYRFIQPVFPDIHVLAYNEIPSNKNITVVANLGSN